MRIAEQVTFGGSGLDRAAELRGDAATLAADPAARTVLLWRGKVLVTGEAELAVLRLPLAEVPGVEGPPVLLGREDGAPLFGSDISGWAPDELPEDGFLDPTEQRHPDLPEGSRFLELRAVMTGLSPRDAEVAATAKALFGWHASHGFCAVCGNASRMEMGGWQRVCPQCGGRHFPRTDPVVIMLITRGNSLLLGRSPHWPERMYSLLAGFVEPGETIEAAVRREVAEETGVRVGRVDYLASQPWPFPTSLMIGCRGVAETEALTLDPVEIEAAEWVSRERLLDVFAGRDESIQPARAGSIAHFLMHNWLADRLD
ncbi:hydrolase, NUDIX family protein [Oceanicola granulosus HTCC2516]|uniref:NAD(+) diphosphatase n=1 Tax=Oceanicola granulosus (strain ATCC BAA-861 / DSM 15982 / KCTC 12143 / HTCC2516) TaxID=314256 RepID=Q2CCT8_OCEGH|nr:NAD(+) diphosphatase [Oceanicola granulosus]EAR50535.1 hydrolase, NUDIX family protein [Oceanicola granulosus HTCC2516]